LGKIHLRIALYHHVFDYQNEESPLLDYAELTELRTNRTKFLVRLRKQIDSQPARSAEMPIRLGWYDDVANWIEANGKHDSERDEPINWDALIFNPYETPATIGQE
jgi:hypothetical protein